MVVGYGTVVPSGHLPVYSVDTEDEARRLLVAACGTNLRGEFVARELVEDRTLESLYAFGRRLAEVHARIKEGDHARRTRRKPRGG